MDPTSPMNNMPMNNSAAAPGAMPMGGGMMMASQMTFYWGKEVTLLFDSWRTKHLLEYLLSLFAIFVLAMLHRWLSAFQASVFSGDKQAKPPSSSIEEGSADQPKSVPPLMLKLVGTLLFGLNFAMGYFLMLLVMSYNGGVFIAVLLGLMVAHYILGGKKYSAHMM